MLGEGTSYASRTHLSHLWIQLTLRRMSELARWVDLLRRWSEILLREDEVRDSVGPEVATAAWLGQPGASESELATLEGRLGCRLPPSYRAFLAVSGGWPQHGLEGRLFAPSEVVWFREANGEWIEVWEEAYAESEVTDEEYFVYGEAQDSANLRVSYMRGALQVSEDHDGHVFLLNPEVVTEDGEWEAWSFADWYPGAYRYRSFREMLEAHISEQDEANEWSDDNRRYQERKPLEAVRLLALEGRAEEATVALRELLAREFRAETAAMLAEIQAFRGEWGDVLEFGCKSLGEMQEWNGAGNARGPMMLRLVQRGALETDAWEELARLARANVTSLRTSNIGMGTGENEALVEWAAGSGQGPIGLGFGIGHFDPTERYPTPEAARARYDSFLADLIKRAPSSNKSESRWALTCFNYAVTFGVQGEFKNLWQQYQRHYGLYHAVLVARERLREGASSDDAWALLAPLLGEPCYPGLLGKVAPMVLLADEDLCRMMNAERCVQVLATVRAG